MMLNSFKKNLIPGIFLLLYIEMKYFFKRSLFKIFKTFIYPFRFNVVAKK